MKSFKEKNPKIYTTLPYGMELLNYTLQKGQGFTSFQQTKKKKRLGVLDKVFVPWFTNSNTNSRFYV